MTIAAVLPGLFVNKASAIEFIAGQEYSFELDEPMRLNTFGPVYEMTSEIQTTGSVSDTVHHYLRCSENPIINESQLMSTIYGSISLNTLSVYKDVNAGDTYKQMLQLQFRTSAPFDARQLIMYCAPVFDAINPNLQAQKITYSKITINNFRTVAVPSISVPGTLDLGQCFAGDETVLKNELRVSRNYTGDHSGLSGKLSASITGDTSTLTITSSDGTNLELQPYLTGQERGETPLTVMTPCPVKAGSYQWQAVITYSIE